MKTNTYLHKKYYFLNPRTLVLETHLDPDPVHYMDLIDSEERFLQKAVGKKHNFSNCECGFFCHNLVFIFIIGKQSDTLQNPFHEKKLFL